MQNLINDISFLSPEIFMAISAMTLLVIGAFYGNRATTAVLWLAVFAMLATAGELITKTTLAPQPVLLSGLLVFGAQFSVGYFTILMKVLCLFGLALVLMMSGPALRQDRIDRFEYPVLVVLSGLGMMVMISAQSFLTLYMGLELSSLALYVLAAFRRETAISAEAGMKYFILGALSSGIFLFGVSLIYGFTGTINYNAVVDFLNAADARPVGVVVGMAFVLAGLAFKLSAVPFHMWTPDVYQGAPGPVTALFAMVPKIAAMAAVITLLYGPFHGLMSDWSQIIAFMAMASMVIGSIAAIKQDDVKRLLAYGSIANIGYALIGVLAGTQDGVAAALLYMLIYMVMTAGVFGVLLALRREDGRMLTQLNDFAGLSRTHPVMAYILMAMLFALAGIPPLAGFISKLLVFQTAIAAGFYTVAIVGALASVVGAYYYLNLIRIMFFNQPSSDETVLVLGKGQVIALIFTVLFVALFIFAPTCVNDLAQLAAKGIVPVLDTPVVPAQLNGL